MREDIAAKRYAEAFVLYAKESIGVDAAVADIKRLKSLMRDNKGLHDFFNDPAVTEREKDDFLDRTFKGYLSQELIDFLKLLIEKRRISLVVDIADYVRENYSHGEEISAVLRSAYPLDSDVIQAIKSKLEQRLDRKLHFYLEIDGSLLGGVQVAVSNLLFDGSVKKRLDDLADKMVAAQL